MKKKFCFLFILVLLFGFTRKVHAVGIGVNNICSNQDVSKTLLCGDTTLNSGVNSPNDVSDTILVPTETIVPDNKQDVIYDIRILVDNSTSMKSVGYKNQDGKSKMETLNEVFKKFVSKIKSDYSKSTIQYKLFTDSDFKNVPSSGNILKDDGSLQGRTTIQKNLQQAYQSLKNSKNIPLVVLFTDGYPNITCLGQGLNDICNDSDSVGGTTFSIKHFYYTIKTMKNLKDELKKINQNAMFITFGAGMNAEDNLAKYFLNPSKDNYEGLTSTTTNSTAANILHEVFSGKKYTGVDFRAYLFNGGNYGFPEYGMFKGEVDQSGTTVTYTMNITQEFSKMWGTKMAGSEEKIYFYFPTTNKFNKNQLKSVQFQLKNETSWTTFNGNLSYSKGKITLSKNDFSKVSSKFTSLFKVKFTFKKKIDFDTWSTGNNFISYQELDDVVDYSAIGELGDLEALIEKIDFVPSNSTTEINYVPITYNYKQYKYTSCKSYGGNSGVRLSAYLRTDEDIYKIGSNISLNKCGPVTLSIPVIMTEDLRFQFNNLYNKNDTTGSKKGFIYAGGGFAWYGATLSNKVYWYYQYLSKNSSNNQMFFVTNYNFAIKTKDNKYVRYVDNQNFDNGVGLFDLNELDLYTDSSCSTKLTSSTLDKRVGKILVESKIKDVNVSFTSIDSNDSTSLNSSLVVKPSSSKKVSDTFLSSNSVSGVKRVLVEFEKSFSLPMAYINVNSANVEYDSSLSGNSNYIEGGKLHYVPLDYFGNTVSIKINDTSKFSYIGNDTILKTNSAVCSIGVQQIFYDPPNDTNSTKKIGYTYRPIDVNDPFPKSSSPGYKYPENWADWYSNDSNQKRLANSYINYLDKPLYSIVFDKEQQGDIKSISTPYTDWSEISSNGISNFVKDYFGSQYGGVINATNSYCGLGVWNASCDVYEN